MIKVAHVITGLSTGGAEIVLYRLLSSMNRDAFTASVVSLTGMGSVGRHIRALGIPVEDLGIRRHRAGALGLVRLIRWLRAERPSVIQTWMYHADLLGGLAARAAGGIPVAWGIHNGTLEPQRRSTVWTARACARLSGRLPRRIVCCSRAAQQVHAGLGYAADKMVFIPNGCDLGAFKSDPAARLAVRLELGIPERAVLIGLIGRFDRLKDHRSFVQAAAKLHAELANVHFLMCGDGITWDNRELAGWLADAGLAGRAHLLGWREDIPRITAALDIASSASYAEALPNVIGEAMACEVPCVVTDVGDSALMVGDTGRIVPPRSPEALAGAWRELIAMGPDGRGSLGVAARSRVEEQFSLPAMVARYEALYTELAAGDAWN